MGFERFEVYVRDRGRTNYAIFLYVLTISGIQVLSRNPLIARLQSPAGTALTVPAGVIVESTL
jgi:hypothetical protein